ncbi:MAG TPA: tripartite tricarboxylate transporter substrate binding protein [Burkholderiales bacterium]|nr:tripartite tricarboxylate transporter substrate binding protein [Burkholderiales bacterium]
MKTFVDSVLGAAVLSIAIALPLSAAEPPYPSHPLRIIVPFAPGGASDVVGRLLAQKLGESMGQTVVVDNRAGAGANIGIGLAAKAQPDGYTLLVASSAFAVNPSLYAKAPYDPFRDFQPITCVGSSPNILAVHPAFPAKSVKELIDLVRTQPGKHNYASTGTGTTPHLSGEMFRLAFKLDLNHIPFNGAGPELQAMVSGQVPVGFASVPSFAPQVKAGQLRGLAVTADQRTAVLPDVPSMGELGITGMAGDTFQGLFVPAGIPKPVFARLHKEIMQALARPDVRERLAGIGLEPVSNTPQEFAAQVKADIAKWRKVIQEVNIKAD